MARVRLVYRRLEHLVAVAVVGGDHHRRAGLVGGFRNLPDARVHGFYRLNRRGLVARVPHHVAVCKIDDNQRVFVFEDGFCHRVGNGGRAHFGLLVVGLHVARGVYQNAVFPAEGLFAVVVEEERHMGEFFRLRAAQLGESL